MYIFQLVSSAWLTEAYSESCHTSKIERIFAKHSILMLHRVLNMPLVGKPLINLWKFIQGTHLTAFFFVFLHSFLYIGQIATVFELSEKEQRLNLLNLLDDSRLCLQKS